MCPSNWDSMCFIKYKATSHDLLIMIDMICQQCYELLMSILITRYSMSGRVVSDMQTRAEGESCMSDIKRT